MPESSKDSSKKSVTFDNKGEKADFYSHDFDKDPVKVEKKKD